MSWKIMIVDDDVDWINLLRLIAGRWTYDCVGTSKPLEALAMAREVQPDVILLDDMMPDLDGFEVMERLRADPATLHIPIVFSSARQRSHFNHILIPENAPIDFLGKPFSPSALRDLLEVLLGAEGEESAD